MSSAGDEDGVPSGESCHRAPGSDDHTAPGIFEHPGQLHRQRHDQAVETVVSSLPYPMRRLEDILQSTSDSLFPADLGQRPVQMNSRSTDGDTPLHVLVWRKDVGGAKALLEAGADPNAVGDMGETPLHVAVRQHALDVIEALVTAGANPDIRSELGDTPRTLAAARNSDIARLLKKGRSR